MTSQSRMATVAELEKAGWPMLAEDVEEGLSADVLLRRLRDLGEADSDAWDIIAAMHE